MKEAIDEAFSKLTVQKKKKEDGNNDDNGDDDDDDDVSTNYSHSKFQDELKKTPFTIFQSKEHLGFLSWNPYVGNDRSYKPLMDIRFHEEIIRRIAIDKKPSTILPVLQLPVPTSWNQSLPKKEILYEYPYGQYEVAFLYAATKHRKDIFDDVDFIFGGSVLRMLATKNETSDPYMVCRVPSTTEGSNKSTFFVASCSSYTIDYANVGYQLKRYVTTGHMDYSVDTCMEFMEHMHVLQIGTYKVVMCVAADAMNTDGTVIKIRALNPNFWGTQIMFQMISNGTPNICYAIKDRTTLSDIKIRSLSDVTEQSLTGMNVTELEQNIITGMKDIYDLMNDTKYDENYSITFNSHGKLQLHKDTSEHMAILPPSSIVKKLLNSCISHSK